MLAYGSSGMIGHDIHCDLEVWKCPIKYETHRCNKEGIEVAHEVESFSAICVDRERLTYRQLPRHHNILECLQITDAGIHFPFMQHGNLIIGSFLDGHDPFRLMFLRLAV